jgi:aspartate aminotransferase
MTENVDEPSARSNQMEPSATLSITAKANELQKEGVDVVNFGAGEPDFPTPDHIKEAGHQAINDDYTRYTAASGAPELKEAVSRKLKDDQGVSYSTSEITIGCGAKHVLFNLMASILDEGDEVILFSPYWVSYPNQIRYFGGTPRVVDTTDTDLVPDPERIREAINEDTRCLVLNSPSNPTGAVVGKQRLETIAEICQEEGVLLISDEIYEKLIYDGQNHQSPVELDSSFREHTVVVNGVSKAYSMTGWRIGYAAGPERIIQPVNTLMSHSTSNPCSISQKAAIEALETPDQEIQPMVDTFEERRDLIVEQLDNMSGVSCRRPGGAFYAFPNVSSVIDRHDSIDSDMELAEQLIEEAHIAVVPGSPFGAPGYLRLSYANATDRIELGMDRLRDWLNE